MLRSSRPIRPWSRLEFGLEEQAAELILEPLERQENPSILFDLEPGRLFRIDVPGALDPMLEAGALSRRDRWLWLA